MKQSIRDKLENLAGRLDELDRILASGEALPDPRLLALQLAADRQTKLHHLNKFIRTNPEHMDARRDRFALLLARMPSPALEPLLAEDAATAWIPPHFEPSDTWTPRVELWQTRATKVMPELEAALRRWPRSPKLWKAWIAWARCLPSPPSVHRMALSMEVLGSRPSWIAGLPKEIHTAVADELRGKSQFQAMRVWFEEAWEGNKKNQLDAIPFPEVSAAREEAIFKGLADALSALKMKEALAELNRQRKAPAPKGNRD